MKSRCLFFAVVASAILVNVLPRDVSAQYFGRNKVQYEQFDFRIFETQHFRLYFYPEEEEPARDMARMAERWQTRLSGIFSRQLTRRKPIIIYANQPDFQQTNTIMGQLTEGTGGVTESLRDRLIMPLTGVYRDNDHVLGHEMVHVFQYDIASDPKAGGQAGLNRLPLWVVEGVAEYLSLGREDPHTAMWMRDAVRQNKLPTIKQLTSDQRFFPYRYGEALWAYVGGRWGDRAVAETYKAAARFGFDQGIRRTLGISSDSLSKEWIAATRAAYTPVLAGKTIDAGSALVPVRRAGESNLSPVISPDGRHVAFFASRGLFGFDLFLADAVTGRSIKRLADVSTSTEFDALSFISSAGAWSPDGRKFAFIVYADGDQEIAILDVASRDVERRIDVPGVGAIQNPAWSPDGSRIAFSATVGGVSDLFVYDLSARSAKRLTRDRYADIQPSWSPDGRSLVFSTDRGELTDFNRLVFGPMRLSLIDVESAAIRPLAAFGEGKHINPQFAPDGNSVFFVSDRSGISDIYRVDISSGALSQVTNVATGVSGITNLAPAFSVSPTDGRIAFSLFEKQGFGIYGLTPEQTRGTPVTIGAPRAPGILPPADAFATSIIARYLSDPLTGLPVDGAFKISPYKSAIALAAIGQPSVGIGASTTGTMVGGGTSFFFTDILGNHNIGVAVQANGTAKDIGGEAFYQNVGRRFNYGFGLGHTPYSSAFATVRPVPVNIGGGQIVNGQLIEQFTQRVYVDQATLLTQYPFSTTRRAELNFGLTRLAYNTQVDRIIVVGDQVVDRSSFDTTAADPINYGRAAAAFVGDNSFFGFTAPISGARYRLEVSPTFGGVQFQTGLADVRKYFFARPITFAIRGMHFGRYGADAESDQLSPVFVGDPSLVRGYSAETFDPIECSVDPGDPTACPEFDRLVGSRFAIASAEVRIPLLGSEDYGLLRSPLFPLDIAPFVDAGVAWSRGQSPSIRFARNSSERIPVFSAGLSARTNLFGYAILELFYARPFQRPNKDWVFGFQLAPGW